MSSALVRAAAEKKSSRILRRDERKQVEEQDRVRGAGINKAVTKEVTRNPTRVIPEVPGFHGVTKLEFKRDARDIDKRSSLMNMNETDSEDEIESSVPVTMRPPCTHDSTAYKKMNRFKAWVSDPKLVQKEIGEVASSVELFKQEMMRVDGEESRWVTSFEASRLNLIASLKRSYVYNARLSVEMKHLHVLTLAECGPSVRKRRMLGMRDALEELNERQNLLQMRLQEYERIVTEASGSGDSRVPVALIELNEGEQLDYEWDRIHFQKKSGERGPHGESKVVTPIGTEIDAEDVINDSHKSGGGGISENGRSTSSTSGGSNPHSSALRNGHNGDGAISQAAQAQLNRELTATVELKRGEELPASEGYTHLAGKARAEELALARKNEGRPTDDANQEGAGDSTSDMVVVKPTSENDDNKPLRTSARQKTHVSPMKEDTHTQHAGVSGDYGISNGTANGHSSNSGAGAGGSAHDLIVLFNQVEEALRFGESAIGDVDMFYQDSGTHDGRGGSDEATPSQGLEDGGVLHSPRSNDSLQGVVQSMTSPRSASVAVDEAVRDISVQGKSYSLRAIGGVCNITRALVKDTVKEGKKVLQKAGFSLSSSDESILSGVVSAEATSSTTTSTGSGSGHVGFFKGSSMSPLSPPGRSKLMLMSPSSVASDLKAASSSSDSLGQSLSQKKQPIMKTEQDWGQYLNNLVADERGSGPSGRKKRNRVNASVPLSTFAYARTPRGVPLLVSSLSQYEDKYIGAVLGGPVGYALAPYGKGITGVNFINRKDQNSLPRAMDILAAKYSDIVQKETAAIKRCTLQSACASSENRIRRLRHSIESFKSQAMDSVSSLVEAENSYAQALREDTMEKKRIRRNLQTCGIMPTASRNQDTPLSPVAETSGWNSGPAPVKATWGGNPTKAFGRGRNKGRGCYNRAKNAANKLLNSLGEAESQEDDKDDEEEEEEGTSEEGKGASVNGKNGNGNGKKTAASATATATAAVDSDTAKGKKKPSEKEEAAEAPPAKRAKGSRKK